MKKLFVLLVIVSLVLSINSVFAEDNQLNDENIISGNSTSDIYVSNDGSDSLGDGSQSNPFKTLNHTINVASDNSNIYLKEGTYNSIGFIIDKSISISGIGDNVVIDGVNGQYSQYMFKISNNGSLFLNNIHFVNGYADIYGDLSCIINEGNLHITNSTFDNFKTSVGVIRNFNYTYVSDVSTANLDNSPLPSALYKENYRIHFIYNIGHAELYNLATSSLYNNGYMTMANATVTDFISNKDYSKQKQYAYIDKSFITRFLLNNCSMLMVNNSVVNCNFSNYRMGHVMDYSSIVFDNVILPSSNINTDSTAYYINVNNCNFTAVSSSFYNYMDFTSCKGGISYSSILKMIFVKKESSMSFNYNWWGDNKGPDISASSYVDVSSDYWLIMTLNSLNNNSFSANLNKYTDGVDVFDVEKSHLTPSRFVKFESDEGTFTKSSGYLVNGTFNTTLLNNKYDAMVYASIDNQHLRILAGTGLSNLSFYVSDSLGNDYYNDGSLENPYKSLKTAVQNAYSGNTIYILSGVYTLSLNSNVQISKNLTFVGLGDVVLSRPNNRNIFIVDEKGILTIDNINFTTATDSYSNPFINVDGGSVTVKNSNFYNFQSKGVVYGIAENVKLINNTVTNFRGSLVSGNCNSVDVRNCVIKNNTRIDSHIIYVESSNFNVVGCEFDNCDNFISLFPTWYNEVAQVNILNSIFSNSNIKSMGISVKDNDHTFNNIYSIVSNCTFVNNTGYLIMATIINNSTFINNCHEVLSTPNTPYYSNSLISCELLNNSYFRDNSFISKNYEYSLIQGDEIYYSTFINNKAAYGGALSNPNEVHYCVFVNNTSIYGGDDIFKYSGYLDVSSNWWGSNQKPNQDRIFLFMGTLVLDDWIILTMEQNGDIITASLNNLLDDNRNIYPLNHQLPLRHVIFSTEGGSLNPAESDFINNASTKIIKNTSLDFDVSATVDNQMTSLTVYNNSTMLLMDNVRVFGKYNQYNISLINVNGHRISNQKLNVIIYENNQIIDTFSLITDELGNTQFDIDYPVGIYQVEVNYLGNGYFDRTKAIATIDMSSVATRLISFNYNYSGKNNLVYAILTDLIGRSLQNETVRLLAYNENNDLINTVNIKTDYDGRAQVSLSFDVGTYRLEWDYLGSDWYESSHSQSIITINPIGTEIILLNQTLYGRGNDYKITFKDAYGTLIVGETLSLTISNDTDSMTTLLKTDDDGIASININLVPGTYNVHVDYIGDKVYSASKANATLTVEQIFLTFAYDAHPKIPERGVFTVILKDMYGKRVSGENISLELNNKDIQKCYYAVTDASGEANFKIDVPEGIYFGLITYDGNIWYREGIGASTITVDHNVVLNNVYLNASDLIQYYGENKYFQIKFNDSNAYTLEGKFISVLISSNDWSKAYNVESDVFGNVRLLITLEPGIYNVTSKYANEYYNLHSEVSNTIIVYKMPTTLSASDLIMNYGEARNFDVKLLNKNGNPLPNLPVSIKIDDNEYNVTTNQRGIARLLVNLEMGYHNVSYSFNNDNYEKSEGKSLILVVDDSRTVTSIEGEDIIQREDQTIDYSIKLTDLLSNPIISSEIVLNITDDENNIVKSYIGYTNAEGIATFNFNLNYGNYLAKTYFAGNNFYLQCFNTNNIYIKPLENMTETILFGSDFEIVNGENNHLFVVLTTGNGEFIKNQEIVFNVKNRTYRALTDNNGRAYLTVPISPGAYEVIAKFNGTDNLTKSSVTSYMLVYGEIIHLYSKNVVKYMNNATHYYVALFDANNNPMFNKIITFYINNQIYETTTDNEGLACFEIWLNPGNYQITAAYSGQYEDEKAIVTNNITVLTTVYGSNVTKYWDGSNSFSATFLDNNGNALANSEVYFILGNNGYIVKTNSNGVAKINTNVNIGKTTIIAINPISYQNITCTFKVLSTISSGNIVKYYKGSKTFKAVFYDKSGKLLKNTRVKFIINSKTYYATTNSAGSASLKVNLKPGTYKVNIINSKTGEKRVYSLKILPTIVSKNVVVKYPKKTNFKVKILNSNGKILKKVKVKFKIKGKTYKIKTNSKGIAKLNIKLKKGKYSVSTSYGGLTVKNKITVKKIGG